MADLNHRQRQFALEYCVDGNATQAAIRAGYSERSAASQGERLLRNDEIQALIAEERRRLEYRTGVTAERVRLEFARVGFSDLRDFAQWGGEHWGVMWTDSDNLTDDAAACIQEITETVRELEEGGTSSTKKFKLYDKLSALKELAKIMGLYPKDGLGGVQVNVNVDARQRSTQEEFERLFSQIDEYREGQTQQKAPDEVGSSANPGEQVDSPLSYDQAT